MSAVHCARGPLVIGIDGLELGAVDRDRLAHPRIGGVILFGRNYREPAQLRALTSAIAALRFPRLLIAVDHEGGRVQRFRDGFTPLPAMRALGELWDLNVAAAEHEAVRLGWTLASEFRAHGVDLSLGPVVDLDHGASTVIGDRALHRNPNAVAHLAMALQNGMRAGGMAAVAKHFPGHGQVAADSHTELPVDLRSLPTLLADDIVPFAVLAARGLAGVMPAHVSYPAVDPAPAGFSRIWLVDVLRRRLGFDGIVYSDDLGMAGAMAAGDLVARADAAVRAGCDLVLSCNDADGADLLLSRWPHSPDADFARRLAQLDGWTPGPCPVAPVREYADRLAALAERPRSAPGAADTSGDR
jgi:beta-N-acetylhexosaminidase